MDIQDTLLQCMHRLQIVQCSWDLYWESQVHSRGSSFFRCA